MVVDMPLKKEIEPNQNKVKHQPKEETVLRKLQKLHPFKQSDCEND